MGGERSEVSEATTRVLLEMATWHGPNIQRTSKKLGLRTEASARFEKGLSPEETMEAQAVAAALIVELAGARPLPGTIDVGGAGPEPRGHPAARGARRAAARHRRSRAPAGRRAAARSASASRDGGDGLDVTRAALAPRGRHPRGRRHRGDRAPGGAREPAGDAARASGRAAGSTWSQRVRRRAEDVLVGRGLHEIAGWSFAAPRCWTGCGSRRTTPLRAVVVLENPMSEDESILRPTLIGSLLDAARHNMARGAERRRAVRVRHGLRATRTHARRADGLRRTSTTASACCSRGRWRRSWGPSPTRPPADFFAAKALVAAVLDTLRVAWSMRAPSLGVPAPGPGGRGRRPAGSGWASPASCTRSSPREWDLDGGAAFALDLDAIARLAPEAPEYGT